MTGQVPLVLCASRGSSDVVVQLGEWFDWPAAPGVVHVAAPPGSSWVVVEVNGRFLSGEPARVRVVSTHCTRVIALIAALAYESERRPRSRSSTLRFRQVLVAELSTSDRLQGA